METRHQKDDEKLPMQNKWRSKAACGNTLRCAPSAQREQILATVNQGSLKQAGINIRYLR